MTKARVSLGEDRCATLASNTTLAKDDLGWPLS